MPRTAKIVREKKIKKIIKGAASTRKQLKAIIMDLNESYEAKIEARDRLNKRCRNESPVRGHNRCRQCGRPRGYYRFVGLCRACFNKAAMRGDVPGLVKDSW